MTKLWTKGIQYMVLSVLAFSIMNSVAKYLESFSGSEIVFYRASVALIICLGFVIQRRIPPLGHQKKWLLIRAIVGTISMTAFFYALRILPLATTVSIRYLSPIFAAIFALLFLKEKVQPIQWLFFIGAFVGVLMLKGFDIRVTNIGLFLILLSAVTSGAVYVIIRRIGKADDPIVIVGYFMVVACITGLMLTGKNWTQPIGSEWGFLASLGVLGFYGQYYMTKAFQQEATARIAPLKYLEAVFVFFIGWTWLGETYSWLPIMGLLLIVTAMTLNIFATSK